MKAQSQEWFLKRSQESHGNRFLYTETVYKNRRTPIKVICRCHGEFTTNPDYHYNNSSGGCNKCGKIAEHRKKGSVGNALYRANKSSYKTFCTIMNQYTDYYYQKARNVHKGKYKYIKTFNQIKNVQKQKFTIVCSIHGEFQQTIKNHLSGQNCPLCSYDVKSKDKIEAILQKKCPTSTIITSKEFLYAKNEVTISCVKHGKSKIKVKNILRNLGCPHCTVLTGFRKDKPGILYYLAINGGTAYKLGITNRSVKDRYTANDYQNIEVLREWLYEDGEECYNKEQELLKKYKHHQYTGIPLLLNGNTELFSSDVLGLDIKI